MTDEKQSIRDDYHLEFGGILHNYVRHREIFYT